MRISEHRSRVRCGHAGVGSAAAPGACARRHARRPARRADARPLWRRSSRARRPISSRREGEGAARRCNTPPRRATPVAQWKLGRMYADGDGVEAGRPARRSSISAARQRTMRTTTPGTPQARFVANAFVALGHYYLDGIPNTQVKADTGRARDMYRLRRVLFRRPRRAVSSRPALSRRRAAAAHGSAAGGALARARRAARASTRRRRCSAPCCSTATACRARRRAA